MYQTQRELGGFSAQDHILLHVVCSQHALFKPMACREMCQYCAQTNT